jgi:hypothetical protein
MAKLEELIRVVEDLIQVMHLQAKELEKLVTRVNQVTRLDYENQLPLVASELSELHVRIKKLRQA